MTSDEPFKSEQVELSSRGSSILCARLRERIAILEKSNAEYQEQCEQLVRARNIHFSAAKILGQANAELRRE